MTKDEEQLIANIMHRMHANEQARLDAALSSARADAVTRAEADRVRMEALTTERDQWKFAHTDLLGRLGFQAAKEAGKVLGMVDGEGLRGAAERVVKERDGLLTQVQDMREEIIRVNDAHGRTIVELDALRAEVADLRRTMTAVHDRLGIAVGENILKAEIERLKKPTRQHPVAVGEWVRRTSGGDTGRMAQVKSIPILQYDVQIDGYKAFWASSNCEPCDPPTEATHDTQEGRSVAESAVKVDPKPGDTVRLVRIPSRDVVSPELRTVLEWPWIERWGTLNQTAMVVEPLYQLDGAVIVCLSTNAHVRWPINCLEVVTEATHDTEAGKSAAESAAKTEPVADEIKVGDVVEVFQSTASCTFKTDIGTRGTVLQLDDSCVDTAPLDGFLAPKGNHVALCDVRKVTT